MARKTTLTIVLAPEERSELESWQRCTIMRAGLVRRAQIVLLRAAGMPILHIAGRVRMRRRHVYKWCRRFLEKRIDGLSDKPGRGRKPSFSPRSRRPSGQNRLRAAGPRRALPVAVGLF